MLILTGLVCLCSMFMWQCFKYNNYSLCKREVRIHLQKLHHNKANELKNKKKQVCKAQNKAFLSATKPIMLTTSF